MGTKKNNLFVVAGNGFYSNNKKNQRKIKLRVKKEKFKETVKN